MHWLNIFQESVSPEPGDIARNVEIIGQLEVIHGDNFEHPEDIKYYYYLDTGSRKYELQQNGQVSPMSSGMFVKVRGDVTGNKINLGMNGIEALPLNQSLQENSQEKTAQQKNESSFTLNWIYLSIPLILILGFLFYTEIKRRKEHRELMQKVSQQKMLELRSYVLMTLRKGFGKEQIKEGLRKNNYTKEEIEEAFRG